MDSLFNQLEISEEQKMSSEEFITKTKILLMKIDKEYAASWYSRKLNEQEYQIAPCDQCKGNGCFKKDDIQIDCIQDREQGECYERLFDADLFSTSIEQIMFNETDFYELITTSID